MSKEARRVVGALVAVGCLALPASAGAQDIWDQNSGGDGTGFFSQQDTNPPSFVSEVADDFFLTSAATIRGVDVSGHYEGTSPAPASSVTVRIYNDAGTVPFVMHLHEASEVVPVSGIETGDFSIPIASPFVLAPGQYWISVQANGLDYSDQIWDWDNRPLNGMTAPAAARTTVAAGCMGPGWTKKAVAGCAGATAPEDQMFSLSSTEPTAPATPSGPSPVVTPPATATGERAAALKKCKKKNSKKKRKKCRKRARRLPV